MEKDTSTGGRRMKWFKVVKTRETAEIIGLYEQIESVQKELIKINIDEHTRWGTRPDRIAWIRKMSKILFDFEETLSDAIRSRGHRE